MCCVTTVGIRYRFPSSTETSHRCVQLNAQSLWKIVTCWLNFVLTTSALSSANQTHKKIYKRRTHCYAFWQNVTDTTDLLNLIFFVLFTHVRLTCTLWIFFLPVQCKGCTQNFYIHTPFFSKNIGLRSSILEREREYNFIYYFLASFSNSSVTLFDQFPNASFHLSLASYKNRGS